MTFVEVHNLMQWRYYSSVALDGSKYRHVIRASAVVSLQTVFYCLSRNNKFELILARTAQATALLIAG